MSVVIPRSESCPEISRLEPLLNAVAGFILATIFLFWDASRAAYVLSSLAALFYLIRYRPAIPVENRLYSWPIIGFFIAALLSVLANGMTDSGFNKLFSHYLLLPLAIPLGCLFYLGFNERRNFWIKFMVACVVMGALALYEVAVLEIVRADAGHNAARFGFIALAMTAIALASYNEIKSINFGKALFALAISMGILAMALSGTRTSWIGGLGVITIALLFFLDRYSLFKRIAVTLGIIACLATGTSFLPNVQNRFVDMVDIVSPYFEAGSEKKMTSWGIRVELWKAAWHLGRENPVFGFGPGNTKREIKNYVASRPELNKVGISTHIHNQFLQSFAMTGLIGLISLLAMLGCHGWLFVKYLSARHTPQVRVLALAGLLLLIAYLVKSLPGVPFYGKQYLVMYGISSAAIWGSLLGALHARHEPATDQPAA